VTPRNVLVTGTARSGTTLVCHLLNKLPDTVALHEPMVAGPMAVGRFPELGSYERMGEVVERFCEEQRRSLHEHKRARSKEQGGAVPDNTFGAPRGWRGLRRKALRRRSRSVRKGEILVEKELSKEFTLVVKHNWAFAALLGELVKRFPVYAIVRNPLPVLASWNSIHFNPQRGHVPAAERIAPDLKAELDGIKDRLDRQIHILGWSHAQFRRHLPDESIIRYESIVETGGAALSVVEPKASDLRQPLENRNLSALYDREELLKIGERLLESDGAQWESYTRKSVEALLEAATGDARWARAT
jgi:hypothetical protein